MEKFRVISDLHMDINSKYPFEIEDKDTFTLVAGDTSGEPYLISLKCDNPAVGISVEDCEKAVKFIGEGRSRAKFVYDKSNGTWKYGEKTVSEKESGILLSENGMFPRDDDWVSKIKDGDEVVFSVKSVEKWLRKNVRNGLIVAGNHLVYNRLGISIEEHKKRLAKKFPIDGSLSFLDNSVGVMAKEVDGILFIGSTLYTDYKLPVSGERGLTEQQTIDCNKRMASPKMSGGGLNDFNFGKTEEATYNKSWSFEGDSDLSYLTPTNYERFFKRTFDEIRNIVEKDENKDKDIVILTHHCPSPKCIDDVYVDSPLNASYVSDLEDFITSHKNIKCWVCGHVHHRADFLVGQCRVVMNPLGYCKYGEFLSSKDGISGDWTPYTYVNTKTWEVEKTSYDLSKFKKRKEADEKARSAWFKKYGGFFFC
jgi:hypothetical protein